MLTVYILNRSRNNPHAPAQTFLTESHNYFPNFPKVVTRSLQVCMIGPATVRLQIQRAAYKSPCSTLRFRCFRDLSRLRPNCWLSFEEEAGWMPSLKSMTTLTTHAERMWFDLRRSCLKCRLRVFGHRPNTHTTARRHKRPLHSTQSSDTSVTRSCDLRPWVSRQAFWSCSFTLWPTVYFNLVHGNGQGRVEYKCMDRT